jgi:hypothetical protein
MHFLDYWLVLRSAGNLCSVPISWFLDFIQNLGFLVSVKKFRLEVAQNLGLNINTALWKIFPVEHLVTKVIDTGFPQNLPQLTTPKALLRTIKLHNFVAEYVQLVRLHLIQF